MTLEKIYEAWSNENADNEGIMKKFDEMALHFPISEGESLSERQRKEYFSDTFYVDYVLPYVKAVECQAFTSAYKQAFKLFRELLKE